MWKQCSGQGQKLGNGNVSAATIRGLLVRAAMLAGRGLSPYRSWGTSYIFVAILGEGNWRLGRGWDRCGSRRLPLPTSRRSLGRTKVLGRDDSIDRTTPASLAGWR